LDHCGLYLIPGNKLIGTTQATFQYAGLFDHFSPIFRVQGELMIGTFTIVAIGKVTLDNAGTQCYST
jgi:hypothetical protein